MDTEVGREVDVVLVAVIDDLDGVLEGIDVGRRRDIHGRGSVRGRDAGCVQGQSKFLCLIMGYNSQARTTPLSGVIGCWTNLMVTVPDDGLVQSRVRG